MSLLDPLPGTTSDSPGGLLDYPDVDQPSCQLLGPTALVVQALMGVLVILSLVYKRHREEPTRPWRIWLFDVSKQVVGQMFVHGVNVLVSSQVSHHTDSNACVFYFLNILIDTTIGVGFIYIALHLLTHLFSEKLHIKGIESGVYGTPPSFDYWARQAAIYVLSLTTMKLLVLGLLALFPRIFKIGEWLLSWTWTGDGDAFQVIFTMGLFPIIMNVLQFWLIDSIVKASSAAPVALDSDTRDTLNNADREPLFGVQSDDEDDDDISRGRHDIENQLLDPRKRSSSDSPARASDKTYSASTPSQKGSGTTTPGQAQDVHSYPPSLSSSLTSASSSASSSPINPKPAKNLLKTARRRSPPSPLNIQTAHQPAVNSPLVTATPTPAPAVVPRIVKPEAKVVDSSNNEWADSWDDSEDWANRIGEEEWTGRRIEEKREILDGVWDQRPAVRVGP